MYRKGIPTLLALLLILALAGCAEEQPQQDQQDSGETAAQTPETTEETGGMTGSETTMETTAGETTSGATAGTMGTTGMTAGGGATVAGEETMTAAGDEQVSVGGFVVESQDTPETTVPEVAVSRSDAQNYLSEVQPIVENSVQDVSNLAQPEVRVENGSLTLDLPVDRLESTRDDLRDGLDQLRQVEPPQSLEPIDQQLIEAYERALPAYTEIIEAADSGDVGRISNAVQENLPRIERFNAEARAIVQDLEQAAGTQQ
jgi:hypothetical protein